MDIPQRFEVRYRVRFDEADSSGRLRPSGLLRYAQDLAWQHSEAAGFGREWYQERGTSWLVRTVHLRLQRRPSYGEHVVATTEVAGWRRVWARRRTLFVGDDGAALAEAETDWVLLSSAGRPVRIPEEITRHFAPGRTFQPAKIELPEAASVTTSEATVRGSDVDPLSHLNNAAYLDLLDDALDESGPGPAKAADYRAEYLRPAVAGTTMRIHTWPSGRGIMACRMTDADGAMVFQALVR